MFKIIEEKLYFKSFKCRILHIFSVLLPSKASFLCACAFKKVHRAPFFLPVCSLDAQVKKEEGDLEREREPAGERGERRERSTQGAQIDI